jgi:hypothetical protein
MNKHQFYTSDNCKLKVYLNKNHITKVEWWDENIDGCNCYFLNTYLVCGQVDQFCFKGKNAEEYRNSLLLKLDHNILRPLYSGFLQIQ